jgi:hypothetical protein
VQFFYTSLQKCRTTAFLQSFCRSAERLLLVNAPKVPQKVTGSPPLPTISNQWRVVKLRPKAQTLKIRADSHMPPTWQAPINRIRSSTFDLYVSFCKPDGPLQPGQNAIAIICKLVSWEPKAKIAVPSATHAMWTTMSASPRIISFTLFAILFLHFIAKTRNHVDDLKQVAKVHISMSPCRAQRRIRASYNKLIARTCQRNRIWHRMLLTIFCAIYMLHADATTTCHPSLFTSLLAIKRRRNRNKHRTRLNQQEKLLIRNIDRHFHAAMDLIHITYAHLKNYILLTNFDAWTTCMWVRRAGPLSIILKL